MNNMTNTRKYNFVKSALAAFMAVLMTVSALMPGQEAVYAKTKKVPVKKVTITKSVTLRVGRSKTIKAKVKPAKAKRFARLKWKSTRPSIVSVKNGKLTAKKPGKAVIVVKAGKKKAKCKVTVIVKIKRITLNKSSISINKGNTSQLNVSIEPADTTEDKAVTWTSSNSQVASVSGDGKVTAVSAGTCTITAKVGSHTAKCEVNVKVPLKGISLNKTSLDLIKNSSETLSVIYNPSDTTDDKTVAWVTSSSQIATIDKNGRVTAKKGGSCNITAKVGSHTATCKVTVRVPLKGISLDYANITLNAGTSRTLKVAYDPADTTDNKTVTWVTSNSQIATVDSNGKVTAKKGGACSVTAEVGSYSATCNVVVRVPLKNIKMSTTGLTMIKGKTSQLNVSYDPVDTTDDKTVVWTTSNSQVATVSNTGKVTAIKKGYATIYAKVGNKTIYCKVTVKNADKVGFTASVTGQTITVKCSTHCYPDSDYFRCYLYSGSSATGKALDYIVCDDEASFSGLNPQANYTVKVVECSSYSKNYDDTQKTKTLKTEKSSYQLFTKKSQVKAFLKKAADNHITKDKVCYFTSNATVKNIMNGIWYVNSYNEYLNVVSIDKEIESKNEYGEPVSVNGKKCYKYTFYLQFTYDTKKQQKKFIDKVIKVKNSLSGSDKNKVKQFDTYMRKNCKYDDSKKKYSAYHALVDGKSVCNGYAEAAAAVLDLAGVKVEFVTGPADGSKGWEDHAWNIVKIGSKWYSCDFCWDSCINKTTYLLKGTKNKKFWKEHKLDKQYKTKAWKKAHPMATGDL